MEKNEIVWKTLRRKEMVLMFLLLHNNHPCKKMVWIAGPNTYSNPQIRHIFVIQSVNKQRHFPTNSAGNCVPNVIILKYVAFIIITKDVSTLIVFVNYFWTRDKRLFRSANFESSSLFMIKVHYVNKVQYCVLNILKKLYSKLEILLI